MWKHLRTCVRHATPLPMDMHPTFTQKMVRHSYGVRGVFQLPLRLGRGSLLLTNSVSMNALRLLVVCFGLSSSSLIFV